MSNLPGLSIITNYAAFRRVTTIPSPAPGYFVRGRQGYGDAGMALFAWSPDSVAADDDDTVLRPDDRASTAGRWVKVTLSGGGGGLAVPVLTAPSDEAVLTIGDEVLLSATSTDLDLDRIDFVLDPTGPGTGGTIIATDSIAPYSQLWTIAGTEAAHTMVARAVRGASVADSAEIDVTLDAFEPQDLGTSILRLLLIADTGVAGDVSQWDDQSGNAHHVTQGTAGFRPVLLADEIGTRDALDFATDDFFSGAVLANLVDAESFCIFAVGKADTAPTDNANPLLNSCFVGDSEGWLGLFVRANAGVPGVYGLNFDTANRTVPSLTGYPFPIAGSYHLMRFRFEGNTLYLKIGTDAEWPIGTANTLVNAGAMDATLRIGRSANAATFLDGKVAAVAVLRNFSAANVESMQRWLEEYYGFAASTIPAVGATQIDYSTLTFARSTVAYEEQADVSLVERAIDVLRLNPDGYAQIEGGYSQVVEDNEDISDADWTLSNCTVGNAAFGSPDAAKPTVKQFVATAPGDASVSQAGFGGFAPGNIALFSCYLRSDNGPHVVTLRLAEGANIAETNVVIGDAWERADVILKALASAPTATVEIAGASAGDRVAVWGDMYGTGTLGHLASHFTTGDTPASRGQDILTGVLGDVPARVSAGTGGAWGFIWVPSFSIDPDEITGHEHGDIVFFSFNTGGAIQEIVWGPPDGGVRDGKLWVRTTTTTPVAKSIAPLRITRGQPIRFDLQPGVAGPGGVSFGKIRVSGAAGGNGVQPAPGWVWTVDTLKIGDRASDPNTHQLDGFISEPFAVDPF